MNRILHVVVIFVIMTFTPSLAHAQDKFFDSNGVQIRYVDQGVGEPIILVHGFASSIERSWVETGVLANLSRDHRVVALDSRGHGKSGKPHDPAAYGAEMSRDVVRLLDHLKISRAHIVGYSNGGRVTAKAVTMYPERFITMTLGGNSGERNVTEATKKGYEAAAVDLEKNGSFRNLILSIAPTDEPKPTEEAIRLDSAERVKVNAPLALAALYRGRAGFLVTDAQMAALRVPALAVVGTVDSAITGLRELQGVMPSLKVVFIEGAAHTAPGRDARARPEFVGAIREFIAAHRAGATR